MILIFNALILTAPCAPELPSHRMHCCLPRARSKNAWTLDKPQSQADICWHLLAPLSKCVGFGMGLRHLVNVFSCSASMISTAFQFSCWETLTNILQSMTLGCPGQHLSTSLFDQQLENISTPETLRKWSTTSSCKSHKIIACPGPIDAKEQIGPSTSVKSLGIVNQHPEMHRWTCLLLPWAKRNLMWSLVSRPFCLY